MAEENRKVRAAAGIGILALALLIGRGSGGGLFKVGTKSPLTFKLRSGADRGSPFLTVDEKVFSVEKAIGLSKGRGGVRLIVPGDVIQGDFEDVKAAFESVGIPVGVQESK